MDRDWSVEVRVELKRLIHDKRATRPGNPDGISYFYKRIDRQICRRSPRGATLVGADTLTEGVAGLINSC